MKARYAAAEPSWEVVEGFAGGAWCKAAAVADGLTRASGDVVVVADSDVWCDHTAAAVQRVQQGAAWAVPHRQVWRLDETATRQVAAGAEPADVANRRTVTERPYDGKVGGGIVVARRDVYDDCPLDERFAGWGHEDTSWGLALETLHGRPVRFNGRLWHLWHPPQPRLNRAVGSETSLQLERRYVAAYRDRRRMRRLIDERSAADGLRDAG